MRLRRVLAFLIIAVLLLPLGVQANELDAKQKELQQIQQQMKAAEQRAAQADKQAKSVLTDLKAIEQEIDRTNNDLRTLENRLRTTENELKQLTNELHSAEQRLATRNQQLGFRLRALYERGAVSYLEVLFNARSFADFINRFMLLRTVVNQDIVIYHAVQQEKELVEDRKAAVEQKHREIAALREQTRSHQANLQSRAASRTSILNKLNQDKEAAIRAYNELDRLAKELDKVIKELQAKTKGVGTGTFTWPTPGYTRITSPFGWRTHPIFKTQEFHSGIDIGAPMNANIVASDSGVVIYSDWLGGYGKTVIIDHGKFSTLYAHCNALLVKAGDKVAKGQVVAKAGTTGNSTGPHLHFEIRNEAGNRVNPTQYVKP